MTPERPPLRLAVLISGGGSNLRAIHAAIDEARCRATIASVISDRASAAGLAWARAAELPCAVVPPRAHADRAAWDAALAAEIARAVPDLVVLAGFMRIVGASVLRAFGGRVVNVHPALLPSFPGLDGPGQAVKAGVRLAGCTVHLVDQGVDTGPILAQAACPVHPEDDAASLHARIQPLEHRLLPAVVDAIATGRLELGSPPRWTALAEPGAEDGLAYPPVLKSAAGGPVGDGDHEANPSRSEALGLGSEPVS